MSRNLMCDGCDKALGEIVGGLAPYAVVEGQKLLTVVNRDHPLAKLPSEFHWCMKCATVAREAVRDAQVTT
jgi:hypothetical protein